MTGPAPIEPLREALRAAFDAMPSEFRGDVVCALSYARAVYRLREQSARGVGKLGAASHWRARAECMELVAAVLGDDLSGETVATILGDLQARADR